MTKQLSAVLAAAAFVSASAFAGQSVYPFSVNDTGPVLTAQQQEYQDAWRTNGTQSEGVAGRRGFEVETATSDVHEVQTPSSNVPID